MLRLNLLSDRSAGLMRQPAAAPSPLAQTTLATVVRCIANTLRVEYGIDPQPVLQSVGIDPAVMQGSELRLPVTTLSPLWLCCVELSGDEAFGLRAAAQLQPADLYGVDLALYASATLGESVQRHAQLIRLLTTMVLPQLQTEANGDRRLEFQLHGPQLPTDAACDCFCVGHIRLFELLTSLPASQLLRRLELLRQPPHDPTPWQTLGIPVLFGRPYGALVFKAEAWDLPLAGANPHLLARVEQPILQQLAQLGLPLPLSALRARLAGMLSGAPNLERLASTLALKPSQLRNGLRQQGLSFAQLLDQAREAQALTLLADPNLGLEQVASRIGFSNASGLVRAFRRWQGTTPLSYRRQLLGKP